MGTSYWKIYNIFLSKITDFDLPHMADDELTAYCDGIFMSAMAKLKNFDHDLTDRDNDSRSFNNSLSDVECEVIASQMVVEWVDRKINTTQNINMFVGTKDENMASQANHIKVLLELKESHRATISALMRDQKYRAWIEGE